MAKPRPDDRLMIHAKMEIEIMARLQKVPATFPELAQEMIPILDCSERKLRSLIYGLREAGCVFRIRGTHLFALRDEP